ncbi:MAG TPA: zinc ABC transporter substrate-binding protein [Trebonia sp.]|jgi:zinc/manganese transport system substrate-binding protein|nr:zinc ABC transporter substrate-binding protein [Trebonia sp.]
MATLRGQRPVAILLAAIAAALAATVALAVGVPSGGALGAPSTDPRAGTGSLSAASPAASGSRSARLITAVAAENQYGNVIAQVGGRYVSVTSLLTNPNTDPHTFEASPQVAREVASARLVVQNGLGYDSFMSSIEAASPSHGRSVITVQQLLHLPGTTSNPHLWYSPGTMPKVAEAVASDLAAIDPPHAAYYRANAAAFTRSLSSWYGALAALKQRYPGTPVATTEPVADYLLQAAGAVNETPWTFQADVMNGVDPSPQDVATERDLLTDRKVRAFVYNVQVTDPLTQSLIALARANGIPVVGVYETMPQPGFSYQSWMLAEVAALKTAITTRTSTEHL